MSSLKHLRTTKLSNHKYGCVNSLAENHIFFYLKNANKVLESIITLEEISEEIQVVRARRKAARRRFRLLEEYSPHTWLLMDLFEDNEKFIGFGDLYGSSEYGNKGWISVLDYFYSLREGRHRLATKHRMKEVFSIQAASLVAYLILNSSSKSYFGELFEGIGYNLFENFFCKFRRRELMSAVSSNYKIQANYLRSKVKKNIYNNILNKLNYKLHNKRVTNFKLLKKFCFSLVNKFRTLYNTLSVLPWGWVPQYYPVESYDSYLMYLPKTIDLLDDRGMTLNQYLYTYGKRLTDLTWKVYPKKKTLELFRNVKSDFKKINARVPRRKWYIVLKAGKYWERFRKKPYRWSCNAWKNKFFRFANRPINAVPLPNSKDIERRNIYRSRALKGCFKYKFLIKRYLKKTLFNNKLSAVVQFLKNKYKKKKCTFWEKTYRNLFGRADMILCWHGYTKTLFEARKLINKGFVYINGNAITNYKYIIYPSDTIYINNEETLTFDKHFSLKGYRKLIRRLPLLLVHNVYASAVQKGAHRSMAGAMKNWWKNLLKKKDRVRASLTDYKPDWLYSFFTKYQLNPEDKAPNGIKDSFVFSILDGIYFGRLKNFLHQKKMPHRNIFKLKRELSTNYFLNEYTVRDLETPNVQKWAVTNELAKFNFNFLMPNDRNLLNKRINSMVYKSSTGIKIVNKNKLNIDNYFDLSKFKRNKFSKKLYMFYLSRVFY